MLVILFLMMMTPAAIGSNDPAAKKIMDHVARHYQSMKGFELQFQYEINLEKKKEGPFAGQLFSKGNKFKLVLPELDLYCDGLAQYAHLKKNNEIQISQPDETDNRYHPTSLSTIHQSGHFEYRILEKVNNKSKPLTVVEFKPNNRDDSVFKIKLFISESNKQIEKVQWYEKTGKTTTVTFLKTTVAPKLADQLFKPDLNQLKGVHVEDLRME